MMTQVIARIVIDMDDWDDAYPHPTDNPLLVWKRIETAKALPFTASEVAAAAESIDELNLN